jgi:hypothetical protein
MKKTLLALSLGATILTSCSSTNEDKQQEQIVSTDNVEVADTTVAQQDSIKGSIPSEATGSIGDANLKIAYHAPGVKGRVIWGGLVPYDKVWVTGAHMATSLETNKDLLIDGKEIKAGKYALFTIPGSDEWTVIVNKNWEQHLADKYDQKDDLLRIKVKPESLEQHQERLKYDIISETEKEGAIKISWEKIGVTVPIKVKS